MVFSNMRADRAAAWGGIGLVATAALLWGLGGPVSKGLHNQGVDMLTMVFLRSLISSVAGGLFFLRRDPKVVLVQPRQLPFLIFYGAIVVAGTILGFFFSVKYMTVSGALLLHYAFPIFTMFGSLLMIKEPPTRAQILAAVLIIAGVGLGVFVTGTGAEFSVIGVLYGSLAVVGISLQTLLARMAAQSAFVPQLSLLYHGFLWSCVSMGLCKTFTQGWGDVFLLSPSEWFWIVVLGFFSSLFAHVCYFLGLRRITAPLGSVISSLELVSAVVFAALLLGEIPTKTEIAGSAIVIAAIALASFSPTFSRASRTAR